MAPLTLKTEPLPVPPLRLKRISAPQPSDDFTDIPLSLTANEPPSVDLEGLSHSALQLSNPAGEEREDSRGAGEEITGALAGIGGSRQHTDRDEARPALKDDVINEEPPKPLQPELCEETALDYKFGPCEKALDYKFGSSEKMVPESRVAPRLYPPLPPPPSEPQLLVGEEDECPSGCELVDPSQVPRMSAAVRDPEARAPAVLRLAEQESSPPSLVPVALAAPEQTQGRLYPELPLPQAGLAARAFTREQLRLWEPGSWLENVELHAGEFEGAVYQDGHELHELLLHYWRCRKQLTQAHTELQAANSDCRSSENRLWSFRDEQLTLQVRRQMFGASDWMMSPIIVLDLP